MHRRLLPVALVPVALVLAACGGDSADSSDTLAELQPSSYVVREPATTTTTVAGAGGVAVGADGRSPVEQQYEVQSGDYPYGVADKFGITLEQLVNYNEWASADAFPYPGTVIKIPPGALVPSATASTEAPAATTGTETTQATSTATTQAGLGDNCVAGSYTIVEGDYPGKVAGKFDVTVEQLNAANANTQGYGAFYVGLEIVIPEKDC